MGAGAQVGVGVVAHGAQTGQRGLETDAHIAQKRLHEDGGGDEHGGGDQDRPHGVGDQVPGQDRAGGRADGPGGQHELLLLQAEDLAPDHLGHAHPVHAAQSDDDALELLAEDLHDQDDVQGEGDGADDLHDAHHHRVHRAPQIARDPAVHDPDGQVHQHGHEGHQQGHPGAVHQPGEDVAA